MIADGQNTLGSTVASAGSYLGSWLGSLASTKPQSTLAPNPKLQSAQISNAPHHTTTGPADSLVSFENLVKNCQLDLIEQAECIIDYQDGDEAIQAIEVAG